MRRINRRTNCIGGVILVWHVLRLVEFAIGTPEMPVTSHYNAMDGQDERFSRVTLMAATQMAA